MWAGHATGVCGASFTRACQLSTTGSNEHCGEGVIGQTLLLQCWQINLGVFQSLFLNKAFCSVCAWGCSLSGSLRVLVGMWSARQLWTDCAVPLVQALMSWGCLLAALFMQNEMCQCVYHGQHLKYLSPPPPLCETKLAFVQCSCLLTSAAESRGWFGG